MRPSFLLAPLLTSCASEPILYDHLAITEGQGTTYRVGQNEGERQLSELSMGGIEDAYVYTDGIWTDVGYGENSEGAAIDGSLLNHLLTVYPHAVVYHIHPDLTPPSSTDYVSLYPYAQRFPSAGFAVVGPYGVWSYTPTLLTSEQDGLEEIRSTLRNHTFNTLLWEDATRDIRNLGIDVSWRPIQ